MELYEQHNADGMSLLYQICFTAGFSTLHIIENYFIALIASILLKEVEDALLASLH